MSSTVSSTQVKTLPPRMVTKLKMEEKPARLVRTSSIEKIRRFNSFICSQNYFILPALITWLKSSQSGLQLQTEKTIFLFRSIFFNTYIYKFFLTSMKFLKNLQAKDLVQVYQTVEQILSNFYNTFSKCFESTFVLSALVYSAIVVILTKFTICLYLLSTCFIPSGLYFLITCLTFINFMYYQMTRHYYLNNSDTKNK